MERGMISCILVPMCTRWYTWFYDLCVRMDSDGLTGGELSTSGEKGDGDVVYHALRDWHCIQDGMVWYQDPGHYIPPYRR
jgi:hypothetical protein